jgi:hypothetical protein
MYGKYYIRSRSSLTGKRVKKDPAFRKTMAYAALLANASHIASGVYVALPVQHKKLKLFRKLTGEAMTWLKYEWKEEDITAYLLKQYGGARLPVEGRVTKLRPSYRRSKPCVSSRKAPHLMKAIPGEPISFELYEWRRRDKQFRKERHKDDYSSSLLTAPSASTPLVRQDHCH